MKVRVKISLLNASGEPFMGIGLVWLLERIYKHRSIRAAAQEMGMSYAKAHAILKSLEQNLGRPILLRTRGGADRGGARLTPFAEGFLRDFASLHDRTVRGTEKTFQPLLHGLRRGR